MSIESSHRPGAGRGMCASEAGCAPPGAGTELIVVGPLGHVNNGRLSAETSQLRLRHACGLRERHGLRGRHRRQVKHGWDRPSPCPNVPRFDLAGGRDYLYLRGCLRTCTAEHAEAAEMRKALLDWGAYSVDSVFITHALRCRTSCRRQIHLSSKTIMGYIRTCLTPCGWKMALRDCAPSATRGRKGTSWSMR
jgi:hypothetical protein